MNAKIIAVATQKGGTAKTTTTLNLGYALAEEGKKVLLIDFDPQGDLTVSVGIDHIEYTSTIYQLMSAAIQELELTSIPDLAIRVGKVDIIPSNIELSAIEPSLVNAIGREYILKMVLEPYKLRYDYILIDCSRSLGLLTINALAACDSVIIPTVPQYLSAKGLEMFIKSILKIKRRVNQSIQIEGILITMCLEHLRLSKQILALIREAYEGQVNIFDTSIPSTVKVPEAVQSSQSIIEYAPHHKASKAYRDLAKEILKNE